MTIPKLPLAGLPEQGKDPDDPFADLARTRADDPFADLARTPSDTGDVDLRDEGEPEPIRMQPVVVTAKKPIAPPVVAPRDASAVARRSTVAPPHRELPDRLAVALEAAKRSVGPQAKAAAEIVAAPATSAFTLGRYLGQSLIPEDDRAQRDAESRAGGIEPVSGKQAALAGAQVGSIVAGPLINRLVTGTLANAAVKAGLAGDVAETGVIGGLGKLAPTVGAATEGATIGATYDPEHPVRGAAIGGLLGAAADVAPRFQGRVGQRPPITEPDRVLPRQPGRTGTEARVVEEPTSLPPDVEVSPATLDEAFPQGGSRLDALRRARAEAVQRAFAEPPAPAEPAPAPVEPPPGVTPPEAVAVRVGPIGSKGAYFQRTGGQVPEGAVPYDLTKATLLDGTNAGAVQQIAAALAQDPSLTPEQRQHAAGVAQIGVIDAKTMDTLPIERVAKALGFDGVQVAPVSPTEPPSVFVWNIRNVEPASVPTAEPVEVDAGQQLDQIIRDHVTATREGVDLTTGETRGPTPEQRQALDAERDRKAAEVVAPLSDAYLEELIQRNAEQRERMAEGLPPHETLANGMPDYAARELNRRRPDADVDASVRASRGIRLEGVDEAPVTLPSDPEVTLNLLPDKQLRRMTELAAALSTENIAARRDYDALAKHFTERFGEQPPKPTAERAKIEATGSQPSPYRADNPFAAKALAARARADRLSGQRSAHDEGMRQSFPLGGGFGRKGDARRIDRSVTHATDVVKAIKDAEYLEAQARAFDAGQIDAQGRYRDAASDARSAKAATARESRAARIDAAKAQMEGKQRWQVPGSVYATAQGHLGGGGRNLILADHDEAVKAALAQGESVPADVLAEYPHFDEHGRPRAAKPAPKVKGIPAQFDTPAIRQAIQRAEAIPPTDQIDTPERVTWRATQVDGLLADVPSVPSGERPQAHLVLGLPGAGKTSTAIAPVMASLAPRPALLDPDAVKQAAPEYENGLGAGALHVESAHVRNAALLKAVQRQTHLVYPSIGHPRDSATLAKRLQDAGYDVHVHLVDTAPETAAQRVVDGFTSGGRHFVDPRTILSRGTDPRTAYRAVADLPGVIAHVPLDNNGPHGSTAPVPDWRQRWFPDDTARGNDGPSGPPDRGPGGGSVEGPGRRSGRRAQSGPVAGPSSEVAPAGVAVDAPVTERTKVVDVDGVKRWATMRNASGVLRPPTAVSVQGLLDELLDLEPKRAEAEARSVYELREDENFHTSGIPQIVSTKPKGGGPSRQAKALRNLRDFQSITDRIVEELGRRMPAEDVYAALEDARAAREERLGLSGQFNPVQRGTEIRDEAGNVLFERKAHYGPDLFGNVESTPEDQGSLFGETAGTEASRSLAETERAARAELTTLRQRLAVAAPESKAAIASRIATLEKLVNRDQKITADELRTEAQGRLLEPVTAYHGTPHTFDRFSLQKIGSGEGNQAYGWGLYFAGKKEVAQWYRDQLVTTRKIQDPELDRQQAVLENYLKHFDNLGFDTTAQAVNAVQAHSDWATRWDVDVEAVAPMQRAIDYIKSREPKGRRLVVDGQEYTPRELVEAQRRADGLYDTANREFIPVGGNQRDWRPAALLAVYHHNGDYAAALADAERGFPDSPIAQALKQMAGSKFSIKNDGALFHVQLPDDETMLLWDKPLSEQPAPVKQALEKAYPDFFTRGWVDGPSGLPAPDAEKFGVSPDELQRRGFSIGVPAESMTGREFYLHLTHEAGGTMGRNPKSQELASRRLAFDGINGIKYLDGVSRGAGKGSYNYVIFDDQLIQIHDVEERAQRYTDPTQGDLFAQARTTPTLPEEVAARQSEAETGFGSVAKKDAALAPHRALMARLEASKHPTLDQRTAQVQAHRTTQPERDALDIRGVTLNEPEDRARLMELYRDPLVERAHVFYLTESGDGGHMIVGHTADTVGALTFGAMPMPEEIIETAQRLNATTVMLGHNHPSGDAIASRHADIPVTAAYGTALSAGGVRLLGHVVIDHHEYAWIEPDGTAHDRIAFQGRPAEYETGLEAGRPQLKNPTIAAQYLRDVSSPEAATVVVVDAQSRAVAVIPMPVAVLSDMRTVAPALLRQTGGQAFFVAAPERVAQNFAGFANREIQTSGVLVDITGAVKSGTPVWAHDMLDVLAVRPGPQYAQGNPSSLAVESLRAAGSYHGQQIAIRSTDRPAWDNLRGAAVRDIDRTDPAGVPVRPTAAVRGGPAPIAEPRGGQYAPDEAGRVPENDGVAAQPTPRSKAVDDAFATVGADIDFSGELARAARKQHPRSLSTRLSRLSDQIANANGPIERLGQTAGSRPNRNPRDLLTYVKASDHTVSLALHVGVLDPVTREIAGPSFDSIFAPLHGDDALMARALTYLKAKRDVGRGISSVRGNAAKWEAAKTVVQYGDQDPVLSSFAQRWNDYTDAIGEYAVKSGLWTEDLWQRMKSSDVLYVRYKRILQQAVETRKATQGGAVKRMGNVTPGVDRFIGSERAVENIAVALAEYTRQIIHRADRYRVGAAVFDAIDDMGPAGEVLGRRIPSDSPEARAVSAHRGKQVPLAPEPVLEELKDLFDPRLDARNPVLWRNGPDGTREYMQIDAPELWSAIMQLHAADEGAVRQFLDVTVRPIKRIFTASTTGWSPRFSLATNPARDIPTALAQSQAGVTAKDIATGFEEAVKALAHQSDLAHEAARSGLTGVSLFAQDRPRFAARHAAPLTRGDRVRNRVGRVAGAPIHALEAAGTATDLAPRLGEYMAAMRQNMAKVESGEWTLAEARLRAATLGRGVTLDFSNRPANPVLKLFADYIPFFGVSIQGPTVAAQSASRNPRRFGAVYAAAAMAAVIAWVLKHKLLTPEELAEHNDRSATERSGFLYVPTGGPTLRIPLGQEMGIVVQGVTAGLDQFYDDDPAAGALVVASLARALPAGMDAMATGVIPLPGIQQVQENAANRKVFGGRPVEPERMSNLSPAERRYDTTPPTFDMLAAAARKVGFHEMSPLKAENLVRGVTSSATPLLTTAIDPLATRVMGRTAEPSVPRRLRDNPLSPTSSFVASRVATSTESERRFYDLKDKVAQAENDLRSAKQARDTRKVRQIRTDKAELLDPKLQRRIDDVDTAMKAMRDAESKLREQYQTGQIDAEATREHLESLALERHRIIRAALAGESMSRLDRLRYERAVARAEKASRRLLSRPMP